MRKLQEVLWNMKKDSKEKKNKGFSLVELIIVIAIMAILVGIVGTQVIPYLQTSREAKDLQLLNSYSTAAVTAYSSNVESITTTTGTITVDVYGTNTDSDAALLAGEIQELTGYASLSDLTGDSNGNGGKMSSNTGKGCTAIKIVVDLDNKEITAEAVDTNLDTVKSDI